MNLLAEWGILHLLNEQIQIDSSLICYLIIFFLENSCENLKMWMHQVALIV